MNTLTHLPNEVSKLSPEAQQEWELLHQELAQLRRDSLQLENFFDCEHDYNNELLTSMATSMIHYMQSDRYLEQSSNSQGSHLYELFHKTSRLAAYCRGRFKNP